MELDNSQILRFKSLFDMQSDFPKENPYAGNILPKQSILEFTFNLPRSKLKGKTQEQQELLLTSIQNEASKGLEGFIESPVHYFERCRDGYMHMHGRFLIKRGVNFAIEGLIQSFVKNALRRIDGRLHWRDSDYYRYLSRYRSPCMCIQYTDELERTLHWEQYIRKNN